MKRKIKFILSLVCFLMVFVFSSSVSVWANSADNKIYLGGMTAGFSLKTRGANVVGICDVVTKDGVSSPAKDADIKVNDVILNIDGKEVNNALDVENNIKNKNEVLITIDRDGDLEEKKLIPAKDISGNNKIGVFIREDVSGIGTITFIKGGRFASLGHPVITENGKTLNIIGGKLFNCNVTGCVKGKRGKAGELKGVYLKNNPIATVEKNLNCGVYGTISKDFNYENLIEISEGEAHVGEAKIYSTICGDKPCFYQISIVKVDDLGKSKNFVIKVTDENLIEKTGGIVQGMSGSPIIQNGKLVGAVTHVFINDPTRGFGISIDNMLNN